MRRPFTILAIGVVIVLSLLFALYTVFGPFDPDKEVQRMLVTMSRLDTVRQESGFSWTNQEEARLTTTLYSRGQINLQVPDDIEHGTQFRVLQITDARRSGDLIGELRHIDRTSYLTYEPPGPDVEGVEFEEGQTWVSFEPVELPSWGTLLPGVDIPLFEGRENTPAWTPTGIAQFRELLPRANIVNASFDGTTEEINDEEARVIDATIDGDALRAFLFAFYQAKYQRDLTDNDRIFMERIASGLERVTIRMWIGADTHRLHRIQIAGAVPAEPGETQLIPVDVVMRFSGFNEPFDVEAPEEDVITFKEVLQRSFGILPEAESFDPLQRETESIVKETAKLPIWGNVETTDADGDGLDNVSESFFGTDPNNPDTDGDGMSDGDEVSAGRNPRGPGSLFGFGLDQ